MYRRNRSNQKGPHLESAPIPNAVLRARPGKTGSFPRPRKDYPLGFQWVPQRELRERPPLILSYPAKSSRPNAPIEPPAQKLLNLHQSPHFQTSVDRIQTQECSKFREVLTPRCQNRTIGSPDINAGCKSHPHTRPRKGTFRGDGRALRLGRCSGVRHGPGRLAGQIPGRADLGNDACARTYPGCSPRATSHPDGGHRPHAPSIHSRRLRNGPNRSCSRGKCIPYPANTSPCHFIGPEGQC